MNKVICLFIILIFASCQSEITKNVGDIDFNPETDSKDFVLCNQSSMRQYYIRGSSDTPPTYLGEKRGLEKEILDKFSPISSSAQNGFITIRFVVNCHGESGWFRVEEMDFDYHPMVFDAAISKQLVSILKGLKGWTPRKRKDIALDFYQYLTFKIVDGEIKKIMP